MTIVTSATGSEALIVGCFADGSLTTDLSLPDGWLSADAGRAGGCTVVGPLPAGRRAAIVGLGEPAAVTTETVRRAVGRGVTALRAAGVAQVAVGPLGLPGAASAEAAAEGALLAAYRYRRYKTDGDAPPELESLAILGGDDDAVARGVAKAEGTCLARDLISTPASDLPPARLAELAATMAADWGLACAVQGQDWLETRGFGLMLGVNAGSDAEPALIVIDYRGAGDAPTVGLVGKGVCFDSGGLSIKPAGGMMTMKGDMGGAAVVLGAMRAIAALRPKLNVTAVVPAVQNLVGPRATRPGDIHKGVAGRTVEVLNTDAEGRLILADALAYAVTELGLSPVVDVATLTGAVMRAVGPVFAGLFTPCDELRDELLAAGRAAGEKYWPLPLDEEFAEMMKGKVADLRNISQQDLGGASTAAEFLRAFVGDTPWVHLDVAGRELTEKAGDYQPEGATGFGVRTLVEWLLAREP